MALAAALAPAGLPAAEFCVAGGSQPLPGPYPASDPRSSATFCDLCKSFADVPAAEPAPCVMPVLAVPALPPVASPELTPHTSPTRTRHPARAPPLLPA